MKVLQKRITLDCAPVVAFEVFSFDMAKWWPMDTHSVSAGNNTLPANLILERAEDGRIVEVDSNGKAHPWGHFQEYQAPFRVLIAWHVDDTPDHSTYIEVVFGMETNGSTTVVLTHSGWDIFGDAAEDKYSEYDAGWDVIFGKCFKDACQEAAKEPLPVHEPKKLKAKSGRGFARFRKNSLFGTAHAQH